MDTETNPTTTTSNAEVRRVRLSARELAEYVRASQGGEREAIINDALDYVESIEYIEATERALNMDDFPEYPDAPPLPPVAIPPSPVGQRITASWQIDGEEPDHMDLTTTSEEPQWSWSTDGQYRVAVELDEALAVPAMEYYNRAQRRAMARRNRGYSEVDYAQEYWDVTSPFGSSIVGEGKEVNVNNKSKNKRLAEWSISARALKDMINRIVEEGQSPLRADFFTSYKFGAYFAPRYRRWFIYNKATANNIATIKVSDGRLIVRYRPNSFYSSVLSDIQVENVKTIAVESTNMHRHNRLVSGYSDDIEASKDGEMRFRKERYARKHNR